MAIKTKVDATEGKQELFITRDFDLPVELLFQAYVDPEIVEQWMGTKVIKLESRNHGSWQYQTSDPQGNVVFEANGTIHECRENETITRTFEMHNAPFGIQLEFLRFQPITADSSRLDIHIIYRSVEDRDAMLKIGMGKGMNMAHNNLEKILSKLK